MAQQSANRKTLWSRTIKKYLCQILLLIAVSPVLAYKTERVCETSEASSRAPAKKICKTVLVMTEAQKKAVEEEKARREKKPAKKQPPKH
jgi:hypothetical protein